MGWEATREISQGPATDLQNALCQGSHQGKAALRCSTFMSQSPGKQQHHDYPKAAT